ELAMASMARPSQIEERLHSILRNNQRRDALSRALLVIVGVLVLALAWPVVVIDPIAPPTPPMAPLPPAPPRPAPVAPHTPAAAPSAPSPPAPPAPAATPEPGPDPQPVVGEARRAEPRGRVVEVSDPFSGSSGPSAPAAPSARVSFSMPALPALPALPASGEQGLTRLDAAFAYDMASAPPGPRVDVRHLVEDGD